MLIHQLGHYGLSVNTVQLDITAQIPVQDSGSRLELFQLSLKRDRFVVVWLQIINERSAILQQLTTGGEFLDGSFERGLLFGPIGALECGRQRFDQSFVQCSLCLDAPLVVQIVEVADQETIQCSMTLRLDFVFQVSHRVAGSAFLVLVPIFLASIAEFKLAIETDLAGEDS